MPAAELGATLFFLASLVLIGSHRKPMQAQHPDSVLKITAGLSTLALAAILRLATATGLTASVPFISEATFLDLVTAIMVITGVVLLAGGVSQWLPISRNLREYNRSRVRKLDLIRRVEQLVDVESRLTVVLEKTLDHMAEQFDLSAGVIFVARRDTTDMRLLHAVAAEEDLQSSLYSATARCLGGKNASSPEGIFVDPPSKALTAPILIPVTVGEFPAAVFALWTKHTDPLTNDDIMLLKLVRDIIGRFIKSSLMADQADARRQGEDLTDQIAAASSNLALADSFGDIAAIIKEIIPTDLAALTVAYRSGIQRATVGANGKVLVEKGLDRDSLSMPNAKSDNPAPPVIIEDFESSLDPLTANMLRSTGFRSVLAIPVVDQGQLIGRLLLATVSQRYHARHIEAAIGLQRAITGVVHRDRARDEMEVISRRGRILQRLTTACAEYGGSSGVLFAEAARVVRRETSVAAVRIATFEEDGSFIRSRALVSVHPVQHAVPADGYLVRTIMPIHQRIRQTGKTFITDNTERLSTPEAQQVYQADLQDAAMIPIRIGDEVYGVITLADRRTSLRRSFTADDIEFVQSVAAVLSLAIRLHDSPWGALSFRDAEAQKDRDFRSRIRSSLTGIYGSLDLLRGRSDQTEQKDHLMGIIDKSARRIESCLTGEADRTNAH